MKIADITIPPPLKTPYRGVPFFTGALDGLTAKAKEKFAGETPDLQHLFDSFGAYYLYYRVGAYGINKRNLKEGIDAVYETCRYGENLTPLQKKKADAKAKRLIHLMKQAVDEELAPFAGRKNHAAAELLPEPLPFSHNAYCKLLGVAQAAVKREMGRSFGYKKNYFERNAPLIESEEITGLIDDLASAYTGYRCRQFTASDLDKAKGRLLSKIGEFTGGEVAARVYALVDRVIDAELGIPARRSRAL